jgi:hypothetical protein
VKRRISVLPPELVSDGNHFNRVGGLFSPLDAGNHPGCRHEQRHHNKDRNDGPRQFNLIAAVNLRGLSAVIIGSLPESDDRI